MSDTLSPEGLWSTRRDAVAGELRWVAALATGVIGDPAITVRLGGLLTKIQTNLDALGSQLVPGSAESWQRLGVARGQVQALSALVLALAAGTDIDKTIGGTPTIGQVQEWIDTLRNRSYLEQSILVAYGTVATFEPSLGIAFYPFLDRDLWLIPTVARAVGLRAAARLGPANKRLVVMPDTLLGEAPPTLERLPHSLAGRAEKIRDDYLACDPDGRVAFRAACADALEAFAQAQCLYLDALFADMLATALAGPVYPMALFTLDFDYLHPDEDPPPGVDVVLAPVYRAAATLGMLERMEVHGTYADVIARLRGLWAGALASAGMRDNLSVVEQRLANYFDTLATLEVITDLGGQLDVTAQEWRHAQLWYSAISGQPIAPPSDPSLTTLYSAVWRFMIDYPAQATEVDERLGRVVAGEAPSAPAAKPAEWHRSCPQIRQLRISRRAEQLQQLVADRADDAQVAVAGRFKREISRLRTALDRPAVTRRPWRELPDIEAADRTLRAEALDFFGSQRLIAMGADQQPFTQPWGCDTRGVCALADTMLRRYSRITGVNWSGRTILGAGLELEPTTDLIRLRFPDWSMWSLPFMAHEFGHLVAFATPEFLELYRSEIEGVGRVPPEALRGIIDTGSDRLAWLQSRGRHLHELFADIFAVLALGPAFAAAALLTAFEPAEAHRLRGVHPTHSERAEVILYVLEDMSARDGHAYDEWNSRLRTTWQRAVERADAGAPHDATRQGQTLRWGKQIYQTIVRPIYNLGAGYSRGRWAFARQVASWLLDDRPVGRDDIMSAARRTLTEPVVLDDLLSALWCARVLYARDERKLALLDSRSYALALFVEEKCYA